MINIITALGNPILNEELKKEKEFNLLLKDIQYQDGIFEILEKENKIDFLFLSEILLGKYEIKELIEKIKEKNDKIKIIIILENKRDEIINKLYSIGINKVFFNNEIEINEIINYIKNNKINKLNLNTNEKEKYMEMQEEINELKSLLIKNNINYNNEKNNLKKLNKYKFKNNNKKIISIAGTGGVGKSIISINLSNILKQKNQKILIIDFDILNNSLHTILGVNQYSEKIKNKLQKNDLIKNKINIKELIIKINKKVDLISGINLLFDSEYKISSEKIKFILEELKEYYDVIIIDTSSECFFDYTKNILNNSDLILFLLEGNLSEIKKANNLLKIYEENWQIKKEKINIIINKFNNNAISEKIIKNIFEEYKVLGKINFNKKYNNLINKKYNEKNIPKKIKKEYKIISKKIIRLKNRKIKLKIQNIYKRFKYKMINKIE